MSEKGTLWLVGLAGVVAGAVIGAALVWGALSPRIARLEASVRDLSGGQSQSEAKADAAESQLASALAQVAALTDKLKTAETPVAPVDTPKALRQYAFVRSVKAGTSPTLSADFAQMLSGKEAAKAASAHGDESPPPNDYYVVNDSKKLRTLKVKPGISIRLTTRDDGTVEPDGYDVPLSTWAGYFTAPSEENQGIREGGYWLTLENDVVVGIEEQYLP